MCSICSCFGWILDLIQRVITFGLTCILCSAIYFGLAIAIVAGIAYGYNYSMAEFLTFARSDVTVFMKRGQFHDDDDLKLRRRSGGDDLFSANASLDYDMVKPPERENKPLSDTWLKSQDTRKYAEILTKYSPKNDEGKENSEEFNPPFLRPTQDTPVISIVPNPLMPTVSWRSGSSKIMMRNFKPLQDYTSMNRHTEIPEDLFPDRNTRPLSISILNPKAGGNTDRRHDSQSSHVPMRMWGTTTQPVISDEPDDVDEDNIVYRPV